MAQNPAMMSLKKTLQNPEHQYHSLNQTLTALVCYPLQCVISSVCAPTEITELFEEKRGFHSYSQ